MEEFMKHFSEETQHVLSLMAEIYFELKEINKKLNKTTTEPMQETKVEVKTKTEKKKCKHCGKVHENVGKELACAKKHKNRK
jgi:hypothetical protein